MDLVPERVILLTDSLCTGACAQFTKKLVENKNVFSIGFGGLSGNSDIFDVGSNPGGTVSCAGDYENSVKTIIKRGDADTSSLTTLKKYWLPFSCSFTFVNAALYNWDSTKAAEPVYEFNPL